MATKKQIDANRLNASRSTGPRTAEGKAVSSMNALKSGIHANSQVIRGEFEADLDCLSDEYYARFHPTSPEQRMLVDSMIDSEWLLRRFRTCEAQLWEQGAQNARQPLHATILAQAFQNRADEFSRLQRRIDAAHRNYRNALQELRRLQADESAPDSEPTSSQKQTPKPPNGLVPQIVPNHPAGFVSSPREVESTTPNEART